MAEKKKIQLNASKRNVFGRKVKKLRREQILPGNVYGKKIKSESIKLSMAEFASAYKLAGETQLIELKLDEDKNSRHVIVHGVQRDPVSSDILHVDFRQVDLTEKIEAEVPVELTGEAPAVNAGGVLVQQQHMLKVEALPSEIPQKFEIDISGIENIGQSILLKDLKYDKQKVTLLAEDLDTVLVTVQEQAKEEEVKPVEAPAGEEGKPAEAAEAKPEEPKEEEKKE